MGINTDTLSFFSEQNRRNNINNYDQTFPLLRSFQKAGADSGDADYENTAFDFSAAPVEYEMTSASKSDRYIKQIHVTMHTDSNQVRANRYGCIVGGLPNGIVLALYQRGDYAFVSPNINTNMEYERFFNGNFNFPEWNGDVVITATLDLDVPVVLKAGTDDRLIFQVNDDLSDLNGHYFAASGWQTRVIDIDNSGISN